MLSEHLLQYDGFSSARGVCHVVLDNERTAVLVGDPVDNPGTSVTNAIEEVAFRLMLNFDIDVMERLLLQFVPWDPRFRSEHTARVEFRADAWSMPVWEEPQTSHHDFVRSALAIVHRYRPYSLAEMGQLAVKNPVFRVRIDGDASDEFWEEVDKIGSIAHVSQRRIFYIDVLAATPEAAVETVRRALPQLGEERVRATTPRAPLDQPGALPV